MRYYFLQNKKLIYLLNINICRNTLTLNYIDLYAQLKNLLFNGILFVALFSKQQIFKTIFLSIVAVLRFMILKTGNSTRKYVNTFEIISFLRQNINISIRKIAFTAKKINLNYRFKQTSNNNLNFIIRKIAIQSRETESITRETKSTTREIQFTGRETESTHRENQFTTRETESTTRENKTTIREIENTARETKTTHRVINYGNTLNKILLQKDAILAYKYNVLPSKNAKTLKINKHNVLLINLLYNY